MVCANHCLPCVRVRVSGGHLCEAEAPTEAAAETVAAVWLTEGLLQTADSTFDDLKWTENTTKKM